MLRPANVGAAALLIGGLVAVIWPQHAWNALQVVALSVGAAAALYALARNVTPAEWMSPFKWMSPFGGGTAWQEADEESPEIEAIRARIGGRRQPLDGAPAMPPEILRCLKPLIASALEVDPADAGAVRAARARLSPLSWAVLASEPLKQPWWFQTVGTDERQVAETVHRVLDELEGLNPPTHTRS